MLAECALFAVCNHKLDPCLTHGKAVAAAGSTVVPEPAERPWSGKRTGLAARAEDAAAVAGALAAGLLAPATDPALRADII